MKRLLLLAPLILLASCSAGRKIAKLRCMYEPAIQDTDELAPKADIFIFDAATGESFEYSDFYDRLESLEGVTTDEYGGKLRYKSTIVKDQLKINSSYSDGKPFALDEGPDFHKFRINIKDMTIESEYQSGISTSSYKVVGSCKYAEPPTTEIYPGE